MEDKMKFDNKFYANLMELVESKDDTATDQLWKIAQDVANFYVQQGISELWLVPEVEVLDPLSGPVKRHEKLLSRGKRTANLSSFGQSGNVTPRDDSNSEGKLYAKSGDLIIAEKSNELQDKTRQRRMIKSYDHSSCTSAELAIKSSSKGISCVVCRKPAFAAGNSVVECQECHDMYHQKCHDPPIPQSQIDPHYVWYCKKCVKVVKRFTAQKCRPALNPAVSAKSSKVSGFPGKTADAGNVMKMFSRFDATGAFGYSSAAASAAAANAAEKGGPKAIPDFACKIADFIAKYKAKSETQAQLLASTSVKTAAGAGVRRLPTMAGRNINRTPVGRSFGTNEKALANLGESSSFLATAKPGAKPSTSTDSLSQIQIAERRLQMMKKRAALKTGHGRPSI